METNIVYFTLGIGIREGFIRDQLIRIPEVVSEIKLAQVKNPDWDIMVSMLVQEVFETLSEHRKSFLTSLVQKALFERWQKQNIPVTHILRRAFYENKDFFLKKLSQIFESLKLTDGSVVKIYVIGPGFDELNIYLQEMLQDRKAEIQFIECLTFDPALYWFWPRVQDSMSEVVMN